MAEAHQGVAFSFHVTEDEGLHINVSFEAFKAVFLSGLRTYRKFLIRFIVIKPSVNYSISVSALTLNVFFVFSESSFKWRISESSTERRRLSGPHHRAETLQKH